MELIIILAVLIAFVFIIVTKKKNKKKSVKNDRRKFECIHEEKDDDLKFNNIKVDKENLTKLLDVNYLPLKIMTKTEIQFFEILKQTLNEYYIFTQVCTSAILKATSRNHSNFLKAKNTYNRTFIDFVICDENLEIIALIELDDKTHDNKKEKDTIRDYITAKAGYKTIRFDCRKMPNANDIKKYFP